MGEPAIPTEQQRRKAIYRAREILAAIRDDEEPPYPRLTTKAFPMVVKERNEELDRLVWQLAATLELTNTALQQALHIAEELNGDMGDDDELETRRKQIAKLRAVGLPVELCAQCGIGAAYCKGLYEGEGCKHDPECNPVLQLCSDSVDQPACDECCGHGNEDGHCHELDERPVIVLELQT